MKNKFAYINLLALAFAVTSCTKTEQPTPETGTDQRVALATTANATVPNTISTIAGQRYTSGSTKLDGLHCLRVSIFPPDYFLPKAEYCMLPIRVITQSVKSLMAR